MDIAALLNQNGIAQNLPKGLGNQLNDLLANKSGAKGSSSLASNAAPTNDYGASYQRETLAERMSLATSSYSLNITTADGRSASLSFDYAAFSYEQQYTRQSVSAAGQAEFASAMESGRELLAQHGQSAYMGVSASSFELEISGDTSLLTDYFASAPTAQRIFDFAAGLGEGIAFGDKSFAPFAESIQRGIANGFAQAHAALGSLAQVSHDTQTLLDAMLARFQSSGERSQGNALIRRQH